jgi:spore germination cell wall hydrolase CwlJ-like protein
LANKAVNKFSNINPVAGGKADKKEESAQTPVSKIEFLNGKIKAESQMSNADYENMVKKSQEKPVAKPAEKPAPVKSETPKPKVDTKKTPATSQDKKNSVIAVILGEAQTEGVKGLQAVINVIKNRAVQKGTDTYGVATEPHQFSAYNSNIYKKYIDAIKGGKKLSANEQKLWDAVEKMLDLAENGKLEDITGGANHYLNPSILENLPSWSKKMKNQITIGNHLFGKL